MGVRIGIDLGTTYSAVAAIDAASGRPFIVKNASDSTTTPSAVCFLPDGEVLFGDEAKAEYTAGNPSAMAFYKRHMGDSAFARIIDGQNYTATDFSAIFLKKLIEDVEAQLGEKVDGAVITVPAYFAHKQVEATIAAARQAGLCVLSTVHEPTAAAVAYGLNKAGNEQKVLFYDLGGGTFDVTVAKVSGTGVDVLGSKGDHNLGGKDWDDAISRYLIFQLEERYGLDLSDKPDRRVIVQGKAEQVKRQLTSKQSVSVPLNIDGNKYSLEISKEAFDEITESLCESTSDIIFSLFEDLEISCDDIDSIILVGGSTKMPQIREFLGKIMGARIESGVNVDEAVAIGAAIKANLDSEGRLSINSNHESGHEMLKIGFKIVDAVAHSLGMIATDAEGERYVNSVIIRKNTKIPASETKPHMFHASTRNTEMEVYVLQGEEEHPLNNTIVNKYVVTGIADKGREGGERVDVTYSYDSDGLIVVTASQGGANLGVRVDKVPENMSWADKPPKLFSTTTILLAIDLSGSMTGAPLDIAKQAMIGFVNDVAVAGSDIGVLLFADREYMLSSPSTNYSSLKNNIAAITIGQNGVGCGNSTDPFQQAHTLEEGSFLVVLTDGEWSYKDAALERAESLSNRGVNIIALGFGSADANFLKRIATVDEFASITDLSKLGDSFSKIAQVIQTGSGSIQLR